MTRWRVWQRAAVLAAVAVLVVTVADVVAGDRLAGRSTRRHNQRIVAVLADPSVRGAVAPVVSRWRGGSGAPVRVDWVPSTGIVRQIRGGEPVDVVVLVGDRLLHGVRAELAEQPVQVVRPGTWLGTVTNVGIPLSRTLQRELAGTAG